MKKCDDEIPTDYFENLWPFILDCNKCDIKTSNTIEYFIPKRKFDHIWAHELLASKCYGDYDPPVVMGCRESTEKQTEVIAEEEIKQLPFRKYPKILPIDQQLAIIQQDVDTRKQLANDFANRKFPWYIQRPTYVQDFKITNEIKLLFKEPFEYKILKNIQQFQCYFMIIDVAVDVPLSYLERWLKFSPYVAIITVIHDEELYGKIKNFNQVFEPILIEENTEGNWQNELHRCLEIGVKKAKELFLMDDISKGLVFVFSHNRGICVCDKFKILRQS